MENASSDHAPLKSVIRPAVFIEAEKLSQRFETSVTLALETFQRTGSFKFRAAYNLAAHVPHRRIVTASSGNFGQALACACLMLSKGCVVVMPSTSAAVKIEAVRSYGATVDLIDTAQVTRAQRVAELAAAMPDAYVASAYDDPLVIEGNATLGRELAAYSAPFDSVIVPIGGGGLASGVIQGLRAAGASAEIWAAEPLLANDAARSLRAGTVVDNQQEPPTIADGARTLSVGRHNWPILKAGLAGIVEVSEENIGAATQLLFLLENVKAEPTGALSVAALLQAQPLFAEKRICCVISGGNVDPEVYCRLVSA